MAEAVMLERDDRDEQIFRARLAGLSPRGLAGQFDLSVDEINRIVGRKMVRIDNAYRAQAIALDIEALGELQARVLKSALSGDWAAGHLQLKLMERKAAALGTDSALKIDVVALQREAMPKKTSTDCLREVVDHFMGKATSPEVDPITVDADRQLPSSAIDDLPKSN